MDTIIKKVAAMGIPGLVLMVAIEFTGYHGAVAITTALAALGPGGMIGGVMTLCVVGALADLIAEYGFDKVAEAVLKELYKRGESKESIKAKVSKYPVTAKLKSRLHEVVDNLS